MRGRLKRLQMLGMAAVGAGLFAAYARRDQRTFPHPAISKSPLGTYQRLHGMMQHSFEVRVPTMQWIISQHHADLEEHEVRHLMKLAAETGQGEALNMFALAYPAVVTADWLQKLVIESPLPGKLSYALLQLDAEKKLAPVFDQMMSVDTPSSVKILPQDDDVLEQYKHVLAQQPDITTVVLQRGDNPHDNDQIEKTTLTSSDACAYRPLAR